MPGTLFSTTWKKDVDGQMKEQRANVHAREDGTFEVRLPHATAITCYTETESSVQRTGITFNPGCIGEFSTHNDEAISFFTKPSTPATFKPDKASLDGIQSRFAEHFANFAQSKQGDQEWPKWDQKKFEATQCTGVTIEASLMTGAGDVDGSSKSAGHPVRLKYKFEPKTSSPTA
nr:uncharacterized protein CI109_004014 [Kwoniella shandongensis]KAA5527754.1 hypothetical protein CI109_004014 [Kwoniella shandongensis]